MSMYLYVSFFHLPVILKEVHIFTVSSSNINDISFRFYKSTFYVILLITARAVSYSVSFSPAKQKKPIDTSLTKIQWHIQNLKFFISQCAILALTVPLSNTKTRESET